MGQRALIRGGLTAAVSLTLAMGLGLAPAMAYADTSPGTSPGTSPATSAGTLVNASATAPPETVLPVDPRWQPRLETLVSAGAGGYIATNEAKVTRWVSEADGSDGVTTASTGAFNQGTHARETHTSPVTVEITDSASGAVTTVVAPTGQHWLSTYTGDAILTSQSDTAGVTLHVVRDSGGQVSDQPVSGLPTGATVYSVPAEAGQSAVVQLLVAGVVHSYLLDLATASAREVFAGLTAAQQGHVVIGGTELLAYQTDGAVAYTVRLDDLTDTVEQTPFPSAVTGDVPRATPVPVGDRVLFVRSAAYSLGTGLPLLSVPVGGGDVQTVLTRSYGSYAVAPDGSVLVAGGSGPDDWAVRAISAAPGADADAVATSVVPLPAVPAQVYGLSYAGGELIYSADTASLKPLLKRTVSADATPVVGDRSTYWTDPPPPSTYATGVACRLLQGLGDGHAAFYDSPLVRVPVSSNGFEEAQLASTAASTITDGSGRYVIVDTPSTGKQSIADMEQSYDGNIALTRSITASAVWGHTLWVPGTTAGSIRPYDLLTRTFGTAVQTSASCGTAYTELQADGRWLYWSCGTSAGVYDRTTRKNIAVPTGAALLGDGFLVRHDTTAGQLLLTDFADDSAATSAVADLPAGSLTNDRGITWSVDKFGGGLAYVDAQQRIHVVSLSDIPRSAMAVLSSDVGSGVDLSPQFPAGSTWDARWRFSRPTAAWTVTVKNAAGTAVATRSGAAGDRSGTQVNTSWDMTLSSGKLAPNGRYTWTISARPAGGGTAYTATGSVTVTGGAPLHDYNGDGRGDLLGVTSAGRLDTRYGTTASTTVLGVSGSGWPSTDRFVAFGDLDRDRYNDLLVLDAAGKLWLYPGKAGGAFTPSAAHTLAGTGFQIYNSVFSPGDLTADGLPDLLLRDSAGKLWLRAGTAAGGFKARTLVGSGYQQYTLLTGSRLVSAGGILARDKSGVLWRQETDGKGHLKARVRIGSGWNQYNSLTQVGSLNGAGADVFLARDGAGVLWRYASNGAGGFTSRVRVSAGWQVYKSLL